MGGDNVIIRFEDFSYSYPDTPNVLMDIDLRVERGEALGIIGPNGAGKSTLCKAMNGLVPHFYGGYIKGRVVVAGMDTMEHTVAELSTKVGLVFQEPENQLSGLALTVEEEVGFGLAMLGFPREEIKDRVREALEKVGLTGLEERSPFELSGGQQQRLAIATVLAMKPEIIVLDEPVSLLDPIGKREVFEAVKELKKTGSTLIIAEHEIEELAYIADRVIALNEGRIVLEGEVEQVLADVEGLRTITVEAPSVAQLTHILKERAGLEVNHYPIRLEEAVKLYEEVLKK